MSIVDRILNGEFDDENIKVDEGNDLTPDSDEELDDIDEVYLDEEEEEEEEEFFEEIPSEEVEDLNSTTTMSDDTPSEEWMKEYAKKNNIEIVNESELAATASVPYVEKPKQSKVREINKKKDTMTTHSTNVNNTPKQSVASSTEHKKRGAPHKLKDNLENVVRFYNEGVGAKQIAEKFGVSVSCVINTLKRNNIAVRPKGRRSNDTESSPSPSAKTSQYKLKTND